MIFTCGRVSAVTRKWEYTYVPHTANQCIPNNRYVIDAYVTYKPTIYNYYFMVDDSVNQSSYNWIIKLIGMKVQSMLPTNRIIRITS